MVGLESPSKLISLVIVVWCASCVSGNKSEGKAPIKVGGRGAGGGGGGGRRRIRGGGGGGGREREGGGGDNAGGGSALSVENRNTNLD